MIQKINIIKHAKSFKTIWSANRIKKSVAPIILCLSAWIAEILCVIFHMEIGIDTFTLLALVTIQLVSSINDLYNKTISLKLMFLGIIIGFICFISLNGADSLKNYILGGLAAFLIMLFLIIISKKQIGGGDLWLMTLTGFFAGINFYFRILFVSIILAGIYSLLLVVIKKANRNTEIPFAPFILFATVICSFNI
jgi:leader peptidase (prepilin peptidase)/N-methyltransferase